MEKLGQLAATGTVGPDHRRHPAVAVGAGLPRRPAAAVVVPRRPHDPAALGAGPGRRRAPAQARRVDVQAVRQGGLDDPRRPDARRRLGVRAGLRHAVRRVPGAGHGHLRSCCGRRGPRSSWWPRPSPTPCARRPTSSSGSAPSGCRSRAWCSTAPTRCTPTLSGARAREGAEALEAARGDAADRGGAAAARRPGGDRRARAPRARPVHAGAPAVSRRRRPGAGHRRPRPRRPARHRTPAGRPDRAAADAARAGTRPRGAPSRLGAAGGRLTLPAPSPVAPAGRLPGRGCGRLRRAAADSSSAAHDDDVGPALQQRPPLPLGHAAPDPEPDAVVQRVRQALGAHRAGPAHLPCVALLRAPARTASPGRRRGSARRAASPTAPSAPCSSVTRRPRHPALAGAPWHRCAGRPAGHPPPVRPAPPGRALRPPWGSTHSRFGRFQEPAGNRIRS